MTLPSATKIHEHELIRLLLGHAHLRTTVLGAVGASPDTPYWLRVPTHELKSSNPPAAGDVDALFVPRSSTERAIAVEFKRVKIKQDTFRTGKPTKLRDLEKGVRQANALAELGFWRVMLGVIIVTDGRLRSEFNFFYRGATPDLLGEVDAAIDLTSLDPDIGVFRLELVQPVDRPVDLSSGIIGKLLRFGVLRDQDEELTRAISSFAARTNSDGGA